MAFFSTLYQVSSQLWHSWLNSVWHEILKNIFLPFKSVSKLRNQTEGLPCYQVKRLKPTFHLEIKKSCYTGAKDIKVTWYISITQFLVVYGEKYTWPAAFLLFSLFFEGDFDAEKSFILLIYSFACCRCVAWVNIKITPLDVPFQFHAVLTLFRR